MTVTYLAHFLGGHARHTVTGRIVNDTPKALVIRPNGASFTVVIPRKDLLHVEVN